MTIGKSIGGAGRILAALALGALVLLPPAALIAQTAPAEEGARAADASPTEEGAPTDFRGKVTLAYGLVFIFVVVYLLLSHRRNAAVRAEIEFLERRLDDLETRSGNPPRR